MGPGAWGATLHAQAAQEAQTWRKVAEAIPLGTKVSVQTLDGRKVKGTLMRVDDTSMQIKKNTRLPEAPSSVTFGQIGNIERDHGGMGWGKAIGFGVGAGAAAMLTILAIAFQLD
ncbi:MAG TPA: hypothetical protein VFZ31_14845 [Vicinamibacterales bacterium]